MQRQQQYLFHSLSLSPSLSNYHSDEEEYIDYIKAYLRPASKEEVKGAFKSRNSSPKAKADSLRFLWKLSEIHLEYLMTI